MYKILFAEDDESIRFIISKYKLWKDSQFKISAYVSNGREALDMLEREHFDLVITDIRMPVIDGLELISAMRERSDHTCTILASTYNDFKYAKEGIRLGALDYIEKPFSEEKLAEALAIARRHLDEQGARAGMFVDYSRYIPESTQKRLYDEIINAPEECAGTAAEIADSLAAAFEGEPDKASGMAEMLMKNIWDMFCSEFSWITMLEKPDLSFSGDSLSMNISEVSAVLADIAKRYRLSGESGFVNKVCHIISENIDAGDITGILSEQLELSRNYISKLFKSTAGMPVGEYITMMKMEYAKKLFRETNMRVYEVSEKVGFTTIDYFTRLFKKYTLMTPAQYRKRYG